jgi:hypothetical protein
MPTVSFSASSQSPKESEGTITVKVQLSALSGKDVTVPFTISGTAREMTNYKVITPSPLVIRAGNAFAEIIVVIVNNGVQEDDKTLMITLGKPAHAVLGQPSIHTITIIDTDSRRRVTVIPFFNASGRKNGGEIMMLHFVNHLVHWGNFDVVEPGLVRRTFLNMRVIMREGISSPETDRISRSVDADLIFTGKVLDYQDPLDAADVPKIDFIASAIERKSKKIIWGARSYRQGDDGVVFFDVGRRHTANSMVTELNNAVKELLEP